ncbi:MAG: hemerythrin [Sulfurimonas sp.]|jgi:hemerythrin|uniref:bacteriohemerythrin n=1 Tax=Sulfurimonas sp. TaxID=2022749 RepID=UPI0039E41BC5
MPIQNELKLNVAFMDELHHEFEEILDEMKNCKDNPKFMQLFFKMIEHTKNHFKTEEELMTKYDFYDKQEHLNEHESLLSEMIYFYEKAQKIPLFGKSYINEYAYDKFRRHILNIDSQLAMFLKENQ